MANAFTLAGSVCVVTGAGSGIGRALALRLARTGAAHVYVCDIDPQRADRVGAELATCGTAATSVTLDVADAGAVAALAARVHDERGRTDLLCNNAGIGHAGAVAECELADWRRVVDVNLFGVIHGIHAFLPRMLAQGGRSHILNTASVAGLTPTPDMVPYTTSKYAVVGLSEALALELAGHDIGVTALCPGVIDTDIVRSSVMRGRVAAQQQKITGFYARRGTSPDIVARDALRGIERGRTIVPTPRYQVTPAWLLKRTLPAAHAALARRVGRAVAGE